MKHRQYRSLFGWLSPANDRLCTLEVLEGLLAAGAQFADDYRAPLKTKGARRSPVTTLHIQFERFDYFLTDNGGEINIDRAAGGRVERSPGRVDHIYHVTFVDSLPYTGSAGGYWPITTGTFVERLLQTFRGEAVDYGKNDQAGSKLTARRSDGPAFVYEGD